MSSKMICLMLAALMCVTFMTGAAVAEDEGGEKEEKKTTALLSGAVVSVDATTGSFMVKSGDQDVTVKTGEKTKVSIMPDEKGKDATEEKIADVKAGCEVIVRHRDGVAEKIMIYSSAEARTKALEEVQSETEEKEAEPKTEEKDE